MILPVIEGKDLSLPERRLSLRYGSHLSCLIKALLLTKGDVLELGMGLFSTPTLHHMCRVMKRNLVSYDAWDVWVKWTRKYLYENEFHKIFLVEDYDDAKIDKPWDVVLVDHDPSGRRRTEIKRLANLAKYIIIHDSNGRSESHYHYSEIYPLFKYTFTDGFEFPSTTVLSNLVDLRDFKI